MPSRESRASPSCLAGYENVPPHRKDLLAMCPLLVVEVPTDDRRIGQPSNVGRPISPQRWKDWGIGLIVVVWPSHRQRYLAKQLRTAPHYQMQRNQLADLRKKVQEHNKSRSGEPMRLQEVEEGGSDFVEVSNDLPSWLDLLSLGRDLVANGNMKHRKGRNQWHVDVGTTGQNNSVRSQESLGLPRPNKFAGTDSPASLNLLQSMNKHLLEVHPEHHGLLRRHTERNELFANSHCPGSVVESLTFSFSPLGLGSNLSPHVDHNNDKSTPEHGKVHCLSTIVLNPTTGQVARLAVILYWKQAAADFMTRSASLFPAAKRVLHFARSQLKEALMHVGPHLFPEPGSKGARLESTHASKTVTYSVFAEAIRASVYSCPAFLHPMRFAGLIYCATATNAPALFGEELLHTVANQRAVLGEKVENLSWQDSTYGLYRRIRGASCGGREGRAYESHPRHRPYHTTAERDTFIHSVLSVHRTLQQLVLVSARDPADCQANPSYYFERAVANLSMPCGQVGGGAHGVGSFGSQTILGVAGLLLPIHDSVCSCAVVGHQTLSGDWLRLQLGFSDDPTRFQEQQRALVAMISHCLGEPPVVSEEVICKAGKFDRGTGQQFCDYIPWCVSTLNYRTKEGILMGLKKGGTATAQDRLALDWGDGHPDPGYWAVGKGLAALSKRRTRRRAGMSRSVSQQFPLVGKEESSLVRVLPPERVIQSPGREHSAALDPFLIARQVGGFQFSTRLVKRGGVALSEEERIAHKEGLVKEHQHPKKNVWDDFEVGQDAASEREVASGNQPGTKRKSPGRAARRRKKRRKAVGLIERWFSAALTVDGLELAPPPGFALCSLESSSLVIDGVRYFRSKDDGLEFTVLWACLTMPERFGQAPAAGELLLLGRSEDEESIADKGWKGEEDHIVSHSVLCRHTTYTNMTRAQTASRLPHLVLCRFQSGARGACLVSPIGTPVSQIHLSFARESMARPDSGLAECVGVVGHRKSGCLVEVLLAWDDARTSWVPLTVAAKGVPWAVAIYSWKNGLMRRSHWRSTKKARSEVHLEPAPMTGLAEREVCIRSHNAISRHRRRKALLGKGMETEVVDRIVNQRVTVTVSPKEVPLLR